MAAADNTLSIISAGETASGGTVQSGGVLEIASGGAASGVALLGSETILSGGRDDAALILGGGVQIVRSGGSASGATIGSGGTEIVASAGVTSDVVISGGTLDLQAGGTLAGSVDFAGAGTLQIDGSAVPDVTISGFLNGGQTIDLRGLAYSGSGSAVLTDGNVLQVSEGSQTVSLNLDPAQNYADHSFTLASDGAGGTTVVDPTVYHVSSEGDTFSNDTTTLNGAIRAVVTGPVGSYVIDINTSFSLSSNLAGINLPAGTTLTIQGTDGSGGALNRTIDGGSTYRGFFVYSGNVTFENLTIQNVKAQGGNGGGGVGFIGTRHAGGGGGGAGLGGGLFVASGSTATLDNVTITGGQAIGGSGVAGAGGGGGGGMLGGGGFYSNGGGGGGGGIGSQGQNGNHTGFNADGIFAAGAQGGHGGSGLNGTGGTGGPGGGGGGGGGPGNGLAGGGGGGGGGLGGGNAGGGFGTFGGGSGGLGGFGGGGGGGAPDGGPGAKGGFGGGGGAGNQQSTTFGAGAQHNGNGGNGGWGGGGGFGFHGGAGGWGGGAGASVTQGNTGGGGGLGAGGDIFVQSGATLVIEGGSLGAGTVVGGGGGASTGAAYGGGIFIQADSGTQTITLNASSGQTLTISGVIADEDGSTGTSAYGRGAISIGGGGTVIFAPHVSAGGAATANTYTGGTVVNGAGTTLEISAASALGSGDVTLAAGAAIEATANLTLSPGTFRINPSGVLEATSGVTLQVSTEILPNGFSGVTLGIGGGGTVELESTANDVFVGNTTVSGGGTTLAIASAQDLLNGSVTLSSGTTLEVTATAGFSNAIALSGDPTIAVGAGTTATFGAAVTGGGTLVVSGGGTVALTDASNSFTGGTVVEGGSTLELSGAAAGGGGIAFGAGNDTLKIDGTTMPGNHLSLLASNDTIDLAGVTFSAGGSAVPIAGNELSIAQGGAGGQVYVLHLDNAYSDISFTLSSDGHSGTNVSASNLLTDGDFQSVNLASGAAGVTTDSAGNYTGTAPTGWTGSNLGAFAPTSLSSDLATGSPAGFAGSQVAYLNGPAVLSQSFNTSVNAVGGYEFVVALDFGTRLQGGPTTGSATVTLSVGSTVIGQATLNAASVTSGTETQLSFVTQNLDPLGLASQSVTLAIDNGTNAQLMVGDVIVQALGNLVIDGNFTDVNLTNGATGVQTDPVRGNYTLVAPPGWSVTSGGAFAPTTTASTAFAGQQVVDLGGQNGSLAQSFASPAVPNGTPDPLVISLDIGTRLDIPSSSGSATIIAKVGSTVIGEASFNGVGATPGGETFVQFVTTDLSALGSAGAAVTLTISNGTNSQVLVGNFEAQAPLTFDAASLGAVTSAANIINGGTTSDVAYQIDLTSSVDLGGQTLTLTPKSGAVVIIDGAAISASGAATLNAGSGQTDIVTAAISNGGVAGSLVVTGGGTVVLDKGSNTYSGGTTLSGSGTLELASSGGAGAGAITFAAGAHATLQVDSAALVANNLTNAISGFTSGETIDLPGLVFSAGHTSATIAGGTLTVSDGGTTDTFAVTGLANGSPFTTSPDSGTGTEVQTTVCYCRGTRIRTPHRHASLPGTRRRIGKGADGEVAVEDLKIGDLVMTASGEAKPVKWIGRRAYDSRFIAGNRAVLPICVTAGAVADGVPSRDLYVSPEHALVIDGRFLPARTLVNGVTIVQVEEVDDLEYFHIELDSHDVIFAEGTPAESFIDAGGRNIFHNAAEFAARYPEAEPAAWEPYEALLKAGAAALPGTRAALVARAAALGRVSPDPDLHLVVDGEVLRAPSPDGRAHRFILPAGVREVTLASRSVVPQDSEAAGSLDPRRLGVPFERAILEGGGVRLEIGPECTALCDGFHRDEGSHRWTDGRAELPPQFLACFDGEVALTVQIGGTDLHYPIAELPAPATADRPPTARARGLRRPGAEGRR